MNGPKGVTIAQMRRFQAAILSEVPNCGVVILLVPQGKPVTESVIFADGLQRAQLTAALQHLLLTWERTHELIEAPETGARN